MITKRTASLCLLAFCLASTPWCSAQLRVIEDRRKDCSSLSPEGKYPDYEPLPKYSIVRQESSTDGTIELYILAPPTAAATTSLARLGCKLAEQFGTSNSVEAFIFDSAEAAKKLALRSQDQPKHGELLWHYRAHIKLDRRGAGKSFVEFLMEQVSDDNFIDVVRVRAEIGLSKK